MAEEGKEERVPFILGDLVAVPRHFKDPETGVERDYYSFEVALDGATIHFSVSQNDRNLLQYLLAAK